MKAVHASIEYLKNMGVKHVFGIPAGSVNAFFDGLYDVPEITPIVTKHEGAAGYMAAAYAKYTNGLSVCVGSSGPGGTNLVTGAANAMREHLPVLFLTGAVPVSTMGLNASQELDADPIFKPVTKYSVTVTDSEDLLDEVVKATSIAVSGVPGPVHIAMPIDVQQGLIDAQIPAVVQKTVVAPELEVIQQAARELVERKSGYIFVGQGARNSVDLLVELAEMLQWPMVVTPQAKGLMQNDHPLFAGVFGFAGTEKASALINDGEVNSLLIIGSSLGETATNNYNSNLTKNRYTVQMDFDASVFNRKYEIDLPVLGDIGLSLVYLIEELKNLGLTRKDANPIDKEEDYVSGEEYNTKNVLSKLQEFLPPSTRYTIDIGEFMAYVIHTMKVYEPFTFDINVHFGAMGSGIGSAIGSKLAEPDRPVVAITGDGSFFMHGMEILAAKENQLPILFVVLNNARLGMVYHGHTLQYKRSHATFEQQPINISAMAAAMDIPSFRVDSMDDMNEEVIQKLASLNGPALLEVALVDNNIPPMGDRVKFLSSFEK